jgi:hypothetical protein
MKFPEQHRISNRHAPPGYTSNQGDPFGWFVLPQSKLLPYGLKVLACDGAETGWEHCSVSHLAYSGTQPTWQEMCIVKGLFWSDEEWVVQYHPAASDYVNVHPGVLHLFRWTRGEFPKPPKALV